MVDTLGEAEEEVVADSATLASLTSTWHLLTKYLDNSLAIKTHSLAFLMTMMTFSGAEDSVILVVAWAVVWVKEVNTNSKNNNRDNNKEEIHSEEWAWEGA